jgi:hypothetical protein
MTSAKAILATALVVAGAWTASAARAFPPGHYHAYTNPYGWTYSQYVHPSRFNPAASYALPGTQSRFFHYTPGYGAVYGRQWIGFDGRPHADTYQATPWGFQRRHVRAVTP